MLCSVIKYVLHHTSIYLITTVFYASISYNGTYLSSGDLNVPACVTMLFTYISYFSFHFVSA